MTEKNFYDRKYFYPPVLIFLLLNFAGIIACFFYSVTCIGDEFEHLRASWFVSLGEMPYRDFFEHHHPLIWFMFAPLVSIIPHDSLIALFAGKFFAACFSVGTTVVFYLLLKRFFGGAKVALLGTAFSLMYFVSWYGFSLFKPDTFMRFFYFCGLYQFFLFCEKQQLKNLVICGIFFTIAFFFLQTVLINIFPLAMPLGYLLYKKKISLRQIAGSAILPLLMLIAALLWLYSENILSSYFELNWRFNAELAKYEIPLFNGAFICLSPYVFCALALWLWHLYHKKSDFYLNVVAMLLLCDYTMRAATPLFIPHYLHTALFFCSVIYAHAARKIRETSFVGLYGFLLFLQLLLNAFTLTQQNNINVITAVREVNGNTLFSVDLFSVYTPRYHEYYWFYPDVQAIYERKFRRYPEYDINKIIADGKIKYIYTDPKYISPDNTPEISRFMPTQKSMTPYKQIAPNLFILISDLQ